MSHEIGTFNTTRFRILRLAAKDGKSGLTQRKVAGRLNPKVTQQLVSLWELGERTPDASQIEQLADILNVPVSELMMPTLEAVSRAQELLLNAWAHDTFSEDRDSEIPYKDVSLILGNIRAFRILENQAATDAPLAVGPPDENRALSLFLDTYLDKWGEPQQHNYGFRKGLLPPTSEQMLTAVETILSATSSEIIISGSRGTGKTTVLWMLVHALCIRYPALQVLVVRNERASLSSTLFPSIKDTLVYGFDKVPENLFHPYGGPTNPASLQYHNGSEIFFAGVDKDASKIRGFQGQLIWYNECQRCTDVNAWVTMVQSLRGEHSPWRHADGTSCVVMMGDCNPDHPEHFLKKREADGQITMVQTTLDDNVNYFRDGDWTQEGARYKKDLETRTPPGFRFRRDVLGEWCAAEGIVYEGFDVNRHQRIVLRDEIASDWRWFAGVDWGYRTVTGYGLFATNPDINRVVAFKTIYHSELKVADLHERMSRLHEAFDVPYPDFIAADHRADNNETLRDFGWNVIPAKKSIVSGIDIVKTWFARPGALLFNTEMLAHAPDLRLLEIGELSEPLKEFGAYRYEEIGKHIGNSAKDDVPKDKWNHYMDLLRYALVALEAERGPAVVFDWGGVVTQDDY